MKKYILSIFIFALPLFLWAQDVTWGSSYKNKLPRGESTYVGQTDHHYFLQLKKKKKVELLQFDFNHNLVNVSTLPSLAKRSKVKTLNILNLPTGDFLIHTHHNRRKKMDYVFASPLMDNGTVEKTETPIISYPKKNTSSIFVTAEDNAKYIDNKGFKISSDSSKILYLESNQYDIVPMTSPYDKFQLYVFDNNFQKIWEKEITFLYSDAKLKVEKFGVSNNGEVYILASRFMHTFHPRKVPEKYFLFYRVNKEGIISTTEIKLDNAYVTDVVCSYHLDGSLFITGIYSSRNQKLLNTHGAFIMKYDVGNNLIFSKKHSFEETLLEKLKCTIQETTYRNYFKFSINYLLINHKKQTISFVAENRYSEPKGGGLFAVFFSDDILVPTFSFDGSLEWITHVDKKFKSPYIYHTPTVVSNRNGNIYLVSNAHKTKNQVSNFNHKRKQTMFSFYTDLIRVNTDGVVDFEKTIFHSRDLKKDLNTALSQRMHNGDFLLYFNTEKTFQYGTLTLPK